MKPHGPTVLVVLGMHRSGTSALTNMLALLGAAVPAKLMPPNAFNARGYWESPDVAILQDELLQSASTSWHNFSKFPQDWYQSPEARVFHDRAVRMVAGQFPASPLWAFKDPRTSILVPFWLGVFRELGATPAFVIGLRHPAEVAASLARRDGFAAPKSLLLWLRYNLEAERATRSYPRSFAPYQDLLTDWRRLSARIARDLHLTWPIPADQAAVDIDAALSRELRHHASADPVIRCDDAIDPWIGKAYALLSAAAGGDEPADLHAQVDRILAEMDAADLSRFDPPPPPSPSPAANPCESVSSPAPAAAP